MMSYNRTEVADDDDAVILTLLSGGWEEDRSETEETSYI